MSKSIQNVILQNVFLRKGSDTKGKNAKHSDEEIHKENKIFGKKLTEVSTYLDPVDGRKKEHGYDGVHTNGYGIPEIIVRCIEKIGREKTSVGLYRINGENKAVKKLR